jgi:hypothetical protein
MTETYAAHNVDHASFVEYAKTADAAALHRQVSPNPSFAKPLATSTGIGLKIIESLNIATTCVVAFYRR